jgi:hypothetical protein
MLQKIVFVFVTNYSNTACVDSAGRKTAAYIFLWPAWSEYTPPVSEAALIYQVFMIQQLSLPQLDRDIDYYAVRVCVVAQLRRLPDQQASH